MTAVLLGFDVSLLRVGWAAVCIDTHQPTAWGVCNVDTTDGGWRHQQFRDQLRDAIHSLGDDTHVVFTAAEEAISRFPRASRLHGYAEACLHTALATILPHVPPPIPLKATEWKVDTVGKGNASKAEVREWAEGFVDGAPIGGQDAADALGVALAGCLRVTTGEDAA